MKVGKKKNTILLYSWLSMEIMCDLLHVDDRSNVGQILKKNTQLSISYLVFNNL